VSIYSNTETSLAMSGLAISPPPLDLNIQRGSSTETWNFFNFKIRLIRLQRCNNYRPNWLSYI